MQAASRATMISTTGIKKENLLLVKMKEKNLLIKQPLPKVLRVQAIRSKQLRNIYVCYIHTYRFSVCLEGNTRFTTQLPDPDIEILSGPISPRLSAQESYCEMLLLCVCVCLCLCVCVCKKTCSVLLLEDLVHVVLAGKCHFYVCVCVCVCV